MGEDAIHCNFASDTRRTVAVVIVGVPLLLVSDEDELIFSVSLASHDLDYITLPWPILGV